MLEVKIKVGEFGASLVSVDVSDGVVGFESVLVCEYGSSRGRWTVGSVVNFGVGFDSLEKICAKAD